MAHEFFRLGVRPWGLLLSAMAIACISTAVRFLARLLKQAHFSEVSWKWQFPLLSVDGNKLLSDNCLFNNALFSYLTTSKFIIHSLGYEVKFGLEQSGTYAIAL